MEGRDRPLGQQRRPARPDGPGGDGGGPAAQDVQDGTAGEGLPDEPRRFLSTALSVGGLAALALGGWLEEVARIQAIEKHFGLPLTMAADPRAAAAFAALPLAVGVAVNAALVVAIVLVARRHAWAGASFAVLAAAALLPPQSWQAGVLRGLTGLAGLAGLYRFRRELRRALARVGRRSARAETVGWDVELRTALIGLAAAAAAAALLFAPLHLGDQTGRRQAADRDVFFVVAAYSCYTNAAVVVLGRDGESRIVRVAERRAAGRWDLRPGLFAVPAQETLIEVRMGDLAPSRPADHPPPAAALPPSCGPAAPGP